MSLKFEMDFSEIERFTKRLGDNGQLNEILKDIVEEMVKKFHDILLDNTPIGENGDLYYGWESVPEIVSKITRVHGGYTVEIINECEYAYYVNYGHHSYNQYGGPYIVKDENRTVMYTRGNSGATFVYGVFFLEDSILEFTEGSNSIRHIVERELKEWWDWVNDG